MPTKDIVALKNTSQADILNAIKYDASLSYQQRIPDATQRLWIAPWVDTDDNFHQPAVVEFVKNKSHWDESYRVIGEGGE